MSAITDYHAHVYYDADTREQAAKLCEAAGETFGVKVGRMHDNPVGPHPRGSCQLTVPTEQFAEVIPWLIHNRRRPHGLHARRRPATRSRTTPITCIWLGPSEPLKLSALG